MKCIKCNKECAVTWMTTICKECHLVLCEDCFEKSEPFERKKEKELHREKCKGSVDLV